MTTQTITHEKLCTICDGTGRVEHISGTAFGGIGGAVATDVRCEPCDGTGWVEVALPAPTLEEKLAMALAWGEDALADEIRAEMAATAAPAPAGTLTVGGCTVVAPGFVSAAQFDAAIKRAHEAGLTAAPALYRGAAYVRNPQRPEPYLTTRTTCTCPAGQHGRPCHHRALACFLADVMGENVFSRPQVAA